MSTTKRAEARQAAKKAVTFKVVQQSYEDVDYDEANPKTLLVPEKQAEHRFVKPSRRTTDKPFFMFGEDLPDYNNKRNMHMETDKAAGEETLFDGNEDECEFDETFLQDLMYGDAEEGEEEEYYEELDEEEYPKHDVSQRAVDKQFAKMMREFDIDAQLNEAEVDDPRAHGPLEVQQYMSTLEEFAEENAGYSVETAEPVKHKGLINQLKFLAQRNRIFDSNNEGMFVTTLLPDKVSRFMAEFKKETEAIQKEAALNWAKRKEQHATAAAEGEEDDDHVEGNEEKEKVSAVKKRPLHHDPALASDNDDDEDEEEDGVEQDKEKARDKLDKKYTVVELKPKERFDCETILTTYSTLYNHPNVIAAAKKKINPNQALAAERRRQQEEYLSHHQHRKNGATARAEDDDDEEESDDEEEGPQRNADGSSLPFDITQRPKDESAEEKKLRRSLIKEMQREKRQQKKSLKTAYREVAVHQGVQAPKSKQERAQLPLSLVRGGK